MVNVTLELNSLMRMGRDGDSMIINLSWVLLLVIMLGCHIPIWVVFSLETIEIILRFFKKHLTNK